jgi:WD40 repeat protein
MEADSTAELPCHMPVRLCLPPRVWDLESGECTKTLEGHTDRVMGVAISSDGSTIVSGCFDKTARWV